MDNNWAAENLQTIRTLMERSAVYRRALAPISTYVGVVGIVAAITGWQLKIDSTRSFTIYWMCTSIVALTGAFLLVRRQAIKDGEVIWSPPTRRIAQAMMPPFVVGLFTAITFILTSSGASEIDDGVGQEMLIFIWAILYGFALHAAGFFMPRSVKLLGWAFVMLGCGIALLFSRNVMLDQYSRHLQMGLFFGVSHLAYGAYLYFTERKNEA